MTSSWAFYAEVRNDEFALEFLITKHFNTNKTMLEKLKLLNLRILFCAHIKMIVKKIAIVSRQDCSQINCGGKG